MKTVFSEILRLLKTGIFWSIVLFVGVIIGITFGISNVTDTMQEQQLSLIQSTVTRNAVQCYAIEGVYPANLQYLVDNYGLYYDSENYVVHYSNIGGNLLPEIAVFYIGEDATQE